MHRRSHTFFLRVILLLCCIRLANMASSGAKASSCASMLPAHSGLQQPYPGPYTIVMTSATYGCSQNPITVSVISNDVEGFKGFLCQPRTDIDKYQTYGTIDVTQANLTNNCDETAVTHTEPSQKLSARFLWRPPLEDVGTVYITCTIVKNYSTFWYKVTSEGLQFARSCSRHTTHSSVSNSTSNTTETSSIISTSTSSILSPNSSTTPSSSSSTSTSSSAPESSTKFSTVSVSTTHASFNTTVSSSSASVNVNINSVIAICASIIVVSLWTLSLTVDYPER